MGGYWVDSPDNPFNQMSYTRGGGGYDNSSTHESNAARAHAMQGAGASALPHFATPAVAQKVLPAGSLAVIGGTTVVKTVAAKPVTSGAGNSTGQVGTAPAGAGGPGAGVAQAATGPSGSGAGSRLVVSMPSGGPRREALPPTGDQRRVRVGDMLLFPDERFPDVEDFWEPRYGEPGELVGGVVNMSADAVKNADRVLADVLAESVIVRPGSIAESVLRWSGWPAVNERREEFVKEVQWGGTQSNKLSPFGFYGPGPLKATPESELPNPLQFAPMSAW